MQNFRFNVTRVENSLVEDCRQRDILGHALFVSLRRLWQSVAMYLCACFEETLPQVIFFHN